MQQTKTIMNKTVAVVCGFVLFASLTTFGQVYGKTNVMLTDYQPWDASCQFALNDKNVVETNGKSNFPDIYATIEAFRDYPDDIDYPQTPAGENTVVAHPQAKESHPPFFFIQLTDPQLGMFDENQGIEKETLLLEKAVSGINQLRPDFVVITGDFVHNQKSEAQIQEFKRITAKINPEIPVYYTPGNHDIGQIPDNQSLKKYRENYGKDRFAFRHKGSAFIGFNSSFIKAKMDLQEEKQYKWLVSKLEKFGNPDQIILFCHYPFYNSDPGEAESYSNISPEYREKYLSLFTKQGVDAVFSGHLHNNKELNYGNILLITTNALGKPLGNAPSGLRLVKVYSDRIEHTYYGIDQLPDKVQFK